ncbi:MAG: GyrI-like domain-containing protein [Nitrososphaerales archaeon]
MAGPVVRFTVAPKVVVASLERRGPYPGVGEAMRELKAWIDSKGIRRAEYPFCLYRDNPGETPELELGSEACIPVGGAFEGEGRFQVKELPETQVAETRHQAPPEQFAMTYGIFLEGLLKGGYRLLGPAREYCTTVARSRVQAPASRSISR